MVDLASPEAEVGVGDLLAAAEVHIPDVRERYARGEVTIRPGAKADKPIVREVGSNHFVKGSGRSMKSSVSKTKNHWLRSKPARDAFNALLTVEGDSNQRGTLPWVVEQALQMIEGVEGTVKCPHCHGEVKVPGMKRDGRVLITLLEQRLGRAPQKLEIEERSEKLVALLDGRVPVDQLQLTAVSVEEQTRRREMAVEEGIVEAEWVEAPVGPEND